MKYSIPILMEFSQGTVPCRWTVDSKHCRLLQPLQRQSSVLSEFPANRLLEEATGKSLSSQPAKPSTAKARLDFPQRTNNENPSVASSSREDPGFARFLRTHSSPLLKRVTAGGKIVTMPHRVDPVSGSSSADAQNRPRFLIHQPTMGDQMNEPGFGAAGVPISELSEHWGPQYSQASTLVDGPTWPSQANLAFHPSREPNGQYAQSNRRQNYVFLPLQSQMQYHPQQVFSERTQADLLYETLNPGTIRQMSPDQFFRTLFPITTLHAFVPPGQLYLDAWMRFDGDRTGNWRGFINSLIEQSAGNSNWMGGLYCDLLALWAPINRVIRDIDQSIACTRETRPRDRDMRVLYINMRQIIHEATGRLQPTPTLVPAVISNVAPNMVPGVSPLLNPRVSSTETPPFQSPWTPQNGSLSYSPRRISRTLSNVSTGATGLQEFTPFFGVQSTGPTFPYPGANQEAPSWLTRLNQNSPLMRRNISTPDNLHESSDKQEVEEGPESLNFDAPGPQANDTPGNSSHVDGIEPVLFSEQVRNNEAPDSRRRDPRLSRAKRDWILERARGPEPSEFDAASTHADDISLDKVHTAFAIMNSQWTRFQERVRDYVNQAEKMRYFPELPFHEEEEDLVEKQRCFQDLPFCEGDEDSLPFHEEEEDPVERQRCFEDLPFREGDEDFGQKYQQMMDSYEEPFTPGRLSLTSYSSRDRYGGPSLDDSYPHRGYSDRDEYDDHGDSYDESNPSMLENDDDQMEEFYSQLPQQWGDPDQAQDAIERWCEREEGLQYRSEFGGGDLSADDCEFGNESAGDGCDDDTPGGGVVDSGNLNNEPEQPGEDRDERNHHTFSDRHDSIGADITNSGQHVHESMLNNLSQDIRVVDIPHDQPIVQLSTDNAHGEITQVGGHQHRESTINASGFNTAQAVPTESLPWVRAVRGFTKACCGCFSVHEE